MYEPPPLLLEHRNGCAVIRLAWVKKKRNIKKGARPATRPKFTLQKRTSIKPHIVKPKFHKNIPMSNHDLQIFEEIVNHARGKNQILLHQNNQIQNINTATCGYFCFYFLNEMGRKMKENHIMICCKRLTFMTQ